VSCRIMGAIVPLYSAPEKPFSIKGLSDVQNSSRPCENSSRSWNIKCEKLARQNRLISVADVACRDPGGVDRVGKARVKPNIALVSCSDGRHHGVDAKDVDGPPEIIDERGKAELGPDIVESLHQEGALVHPLLDAAERMFGLTPSRRPRCPRS
jgi:hypothetical protein